MVNNTPVSGQIVSIRLKNFMSFDDIELQPGFNLNLIIGPNGTGKSTFVCAVILGLGGKLKAIARADRFCSYVRNGCSECSIEIELYEPDNENVVITRKINSENRSEFYINGKISTLAKVNDIRAKYNIQLDNLCSFLPQEKVQDFSKLNPQQLLDQTQKTVGCNNMLENYNRLKQLQLHIKNKERQSQILTKKIEEEKQKNDRIKGKVKSFLENKALCDKLSLINQKKAWLCYYKGLERMTEIVNDFKLCKDKYSEKKREYEMLLDEIKKKEEDIKSSQEDHLKSKNVWATRKARLETELKNLRKYVERLEGFDSIVESKLSEEENKKKELNQYQETLDKLKNDLHTFESKNGTEEQIRIKEEEVNAEILSNQKEESRMMEKKVSLEDELGQLKNEIKNTSMEYQILEKRRNYRLEYLKRYEPDVYRSVEWLKEHRHLFQSRIYNPMLLELDVTNVKYAKYIEARIAYRDLISFTCTNPDDLNLLIQKVRIEQKLKINAICSEEDDVNRYSPEIPLNQIRSLGFFSYMKDLIVGPNHIIRYLCKVYKIHTIPIGDEMVKVKCDKVPTALQIFFSEDHMFTVKVSVYSGDKSINVKQLNEPKLFSVSLDNEKIKKIIERERELVTLSGEKEMKLKLATHFLKSSVEQLEELRQRKRDLATLRKEKEQIISKIKRAEHNVSDIQSALKDPSTILEEVEKERKDLKKEINLSIHLIKDINESIKKSMDVKQECEIKYKIYRLRLYNMLQIKEDWCEDLQKLEQTMNNIKAIKQESEANCLQLKEAAKKLTDGISPGEKGFEKFEDLFRKLKNTLEELESDTQEIQVVAEFITGGDVETIQDYEKREEEISKLNNALQQSIISLEETKTELTQLRNRWVAPITDLVSKINASFSSFFETMGCVGEVCLITGENKDDFDEYGIAIRVKFRDEVPLENLGRHFQSGGERAVATAVYLLSLQELICVPFRFVDEINQGMDSTNERRIINLMIDVTDKKNSTQYFFITPKLLPDIRCSESMVTHCIFSGRNAIPSKNWNLESFLSKN